MLYIPFTKDREAELIQLWNQEIGSYFPIKPELFHQNSIRDKNIFAEGSWLAVDQQNRVIGFIISKCWKEDMLDISLGKGRGWIQVIIVDSGSRNHGVGSSLLKKAENAFKEKGIVQISLGTDPWHYFPGIPSHFVKQIEWFEKRGYVYTRTMHDLHRYYEVSAPNLLPQKEEVQFRILKHNEKEALTSFLSRYFSQRWAYEARKYFEYGGTGREFVVLEKDQQIIAFCRVNDSNSPVIAQNTYWQPLFEGELGGVGPLGVNPNYRKKGYGTAIVEAGIYFLRERGVQNIVIDWTDLVEFYEALNYKVWKSYAQFHKNL